MSALEEPQVLGGHRGEPPRHRRAALAHVVQKFLYGPYLEGPGSGSDLLHQLRPGFPAHLAVGLQVFPELEVHDGVPGVLPEEAVGPHLVAVRVQQVLQGAGTGELVLLAHAQQRPLVRRPALGNGTGRTLGHGPAVLGGEPFVDDRSGGERQSHGRRDQDRPEPVEAGPAGCGTAIRTTRGGRAGGGIGSLPPGDGIGCGDFVGCGRGIRRRGVLPSGFGGPLTAVLCPRGPAQHPCLFELRRRGTQLGVQSLHHPRRSGRQVPRIQIARQRRLADPKPRGQRLLRRPSPAGRAHGLLPPAAQQPRQLHPRAPFPVLATPRLRHVPASPCRHAEQPGLRTPCMAA